MAKGAKFVVRRVAALFTFFERAEGFDLSLLLSTANQIDSDLTISCRTALYWLSSSRCRLGRGLRATQVRCQSLRLLDVTEGFFDIFAGRLLGVALE